MSRWADRLEPQYARAEWLTRQIEERRRDGRPHAYFAAELRSLTELLEIATTARSEAQARQRAREAAGRSRIEAEEARHL